MTCVIVVALIAAGCNEREFGRSIGRPNADPVERPDPSVLRITEVYVADADTNEHFAELLLLEAPGISLDGSSLCSPQACLELSGSLDPENRMVVEIGELSLPKSVGELALVDSDGAVNAYLAWGADTAVLGSQLAALAVARGVIEAGAFVSLPFPMPDFVAVGNELSGRGCAAPSPLTEAALDPSLCVEQRLPLEITELLPGEEGGDSWVEIHNPTVNAIRLAGARLCQVPSCVAFGYEDTVGAQARILVHLGVERDTQDAAQIFFPSSPPVRADGELVLLAPGRADVASEPDAFLSFVRYGPTSGALSETAVQAGLWPEILDAARAPRVTGESLSLDLSGDSGGNTWNPVFPPTPLDENPAIDQDLWMSCSFPNPWDTVEPAPSHLVIRKISNTTPETIEILNRGDEPVDLSAWQVALGTVSRRLTDNAPTGVASASTDESVARQPNHTDTDFDFDDWTRGEATIGADNGGVGLCTKELVINEVVVDPQQDWDDSTVTADAVLFDSTPGPGPADEMDQWIEIHKCGGSTIDLTGYKIHLVDSDHNTVELGVTNEGQTLVLSDGAITDLDAGEYLVVGNPDPAGGMDPEIEIRLEDPDGNVLDRVVLGTHLAETEKATIEINPEDDDCNDNLCWVDPTAVIGAVGEASLLEDESIRQHIQWGDETATRARARQAVDAGVWPLERCTLPSLEPDDTITLPSNETGQSPPDYRQQ
ncbi:hypothetical protein ACFL6C_12295 [Myxococcota bacterium]